MYLEQETHHEEENRMLRASFMGDIREDIEFLGMSLKDLVWIFGTTLTIAMISFIFPVVFWIRLIVITAVFILSSTGRYLKWPFKRKRWFYNFRQRREWKAENIETFLGTKEDGWIYRSGMSIQFVLHVEAPPWQTAIVSNKRMRLGGYESFLRACVREGFTPDISAEQIPDFRHEIWNSKRSKKSASKGIENLKQNRLEMWEQLARSGDAQRSEFTLMMSIDEFRIAIRERDDEPEGLSKLELQRHRLISELREKKDRVLNSLENSGHICTIMSGFAVPELIGRWADRKWWDNWKASQGTWEEPESEDEGIEVENDVNSEEKSKEIETLIESPEMNSVTSWDESNEEILTDQGEEAVVIMEEERTESNPLEQSKRKNISLALALLMISVKWLRDRIEQGFISLKKRRNENKQKVVVIPLMESEIETDAVIVQVEEASESKIQGIKLLTSPAPTGVSFLAGNIAAANSSIQHPISLIDISSDKGTLTVLNPVSVPIESEAWEMWTTVHAPGLTIWTPRLYPTIKEIDQLMIERLQEGPVIVELPWNYPGREELIQRYGAVGVIDADYHHWLQWEKSVKEWSGEIWLNLVNDVMETRMTSLVKEHFHKQVSLSFPLFTDANEWLYLGRPLAVNPQARRLFLFSNKEEAAC